MYPYYPNRFYPAMVGALCTAIISILLSCQSQAFGDSPENVAPLDEVLVTGERPGPGMWRISKDGRTLWILATLEPLPKNMTWRSVAVQQRIADSQVVLSAPDVNVQLGFFRGIALIPALLHARKNPDGKSLEQILPHELYIRWLALRVKYLGSYDEHKRPIVAAIDLYDGALKSAGLTSDAMVWSMVEKVARKSGVVVQPVMLNIKLDDAKSSVRELAAISRDAEIACFATTLDRVEVDLQPMRQRANFWSLGDIAGLRGLPYPDDDAACLNALLSVPQFRVQFERTRNDLDRLWLASAEEAIAKNISSFAVLPITKLLKTEGALDSLKSAGYDVVDPP